MGCRGDNVRDGDAGDVAGVGCLCLSMYGDQGGETGNGGCCGEDARDDEDDTGEGCHSTYCD